MLKGGTERRCYSAKFEDTHSSDPRSPRENGCLALDPRGTCLVAGAEFEDTHFSGAHGAGKNGRLSPVRRDTPSSEARGGDENGYSASVRRRHRLARGNAPPPSQPGVTPREKRPQTPRGLKARFPQTPPWAPHLPSGNVGVFDFLRMRKSRRCTWPRVLFDRGLSLWMKLIDFPISSAVAPTVPAGDGAGG